MMRLNADIRALAYQPRTQEILQTLGLLHKLDSLGHRLTETAFWRQSSGGILERVSAGPEVVHREYITIRYTSQI